MAGHAGVRGARDQVIAATDGGELRPVREHAVGVIIGSPLANSLLAGPEPIQTEVGIHDEDGNKVFGSAKVNHTGRYLATLFLKTKYLIFP